MDLCNVKAVGGNFWIAGISGIVWCCLCDIDLMKWGGEIVVWADSSSLLKRCAYCHESVSVFEGMLGDFGKWYHDSCMIHLLWKDIWKYRKKFIDCKMTFGDAIDLAEKLNLYHKLRSEKTEFKGVKPVTETKIQTRVVKEKVVSCLPDPQAAREIQEAVERAKNRIFEDLHRKYITEEQARKQIADLMEQARDLNQQPGAKFTPILVDGKPVVEEISTTVKEFKYQISRPEVVRTVNNIPPQLTTPEKILSDMKQSGSSLKDPFVKLIGESEHIEDEGN